MPADLPPARHTLEAAQVIKALDTSEAGLEPGEIRRRFEEAGPNEIREKAGRSIGQIGYE